MKVLSESVEVFAFALLPFAKFDYITWYDIGK